MKNIAQYIYLFFFVTSGWILGQGSPIPAQTHSLYEDPLGATVGFKTLEKKTLSPKEQIDENIGLLAQDPVLRTANWGFVIYDPKSKKIINSHNETNAFVPASTTKLLTTDTALTLLGPSFRWVTQLEYSGSVDDNGILEGNLYIVGSGDPSLGTGKAGASTYSTIVNDFKYAIAEKGIKKINGNIIIQTAIFRENKINTLPENIVWLEHKNYFLPVGSTRDIDPKNERITIRKKNPFQGGGQTYFYISPYTNRLVYADKFEGTWIDTKIADAPAYLANSLRNALLKSGIAVTGKVIEKIVDREPENRILITAYKSPQLRDIVYDTNQRSDNPLSEAMLRMVGFQKYGNQNLETGKKVVVESLESKKFDTSSLVYIDGSGLSRSHRVTPISQALFLANGMKETYFKDFFDSLPIAGQTGTLKRSFMGDAYGQIFAKTGTLNRVKTLAGYIKTRTGKILTFSLLINNYSGSVDQVKKRMEQLLTPAINL